VAAHVDIHCLLNATSLNEAQKATACLQRDRRARLAKLSTILASGDSVRTGSHGSAPLTSVHASESVAVDDSGSPALVPFGPQVAPCAAPVDDVSSVSSDWSLNSITASDPPCPEDGDAPGMSYLRALSNSNATVPYGAHAHAQPYGHPHGHVHGWAPQGGGSPAVSTGVPRAGGPASSPLQWGARASLPYLEHASQPLDSPVAAAPSYPHAGMGLASRPPLSAAAYVGYGQPGPRGGAPFLAQQSQLPPQPQQPVSTAPRPLGAATARMFYR